MAAERRTQSSARREMRDMDMRLFQAAETGRRDGRQSRRQDPVVPETGGRQASTQSSSRQTAVRRRKIPDPEAGRTRKVQQAAGRTPRQAGRQVQAGRHPAPSRMAGGRHPRQTAQV